MKLHISNPHVTIELQTVEWATIAKSSFFHAIVWNFFMKNELSPYHLPDKKTINFNIEL